ncbi:unnamed protein product [Cylicostephanus goldi]|uniref:Uncharacterized protein n=1 Tax=Cylicostephanus goldi TaxID=71465 RepID=A0A3P7Q0X3_CYLGO|nr:unnamed protein product [Cylicostephanus goldi]
MLMCHCKPGNVPISENAHDAHFPSIILDRCVTNIDGLSAAAQFKVEGLFYLGIPRGKDAIHYNAHRIYGRMRLAMIMTGFEWLATYRRDNPHSIATTEDDYKDTSGPQDLFVLRKN